jgi:ribonucleoside-diphosphate reductase alpha chain
MFDENALLILRKRYLAKNEKGEVIETPEGLFRRVADAVSLAEDSFIDGARERMGEAFFHIMSSLLFLPIPLPS